MSQRQIRPPPSTLSKNALGGGPRGQCPGGLAPVIPFQGGRASEGLFPLQGPLSAPASLTMLFLGVFGQSSLGLGSWDCQGGLGQEEGSGRLAWEEMELGHHLGREHLLVLLPGCGACELRLRKQPRQHLPIAKPGARARVFTQLSKFWHLQSPSKQD